MPTSITSGSCGLGAIQRTCEVQGRGGKLQSGRDGISLIATSSSQLSPPSRLRNSRLGSVPTYTVPSAALTARLNTSRSGNGTSSKVSPPSALRFRPRPRHPTYTVSPSSARHCAPESCRRVWAPTLTNASPVVASSSIAIGSRVTAAHARPRGCRPRRTRQGAAVADGEPCSCCVPSEDSGNPRDRSRSIKLGTGAACARGARERDHEAVGARLGAPYLAVAAEQLADVRCLLPQPEALEALAGRIEAHQRVGAEVGQPDQVRVVHVHGIGLRVVPGQAPLAPAPRARVVHPEL